MKQTHEYEMEMLTAQMTSIERALASLMQSSPSVSGKASALVALIKDSGGFDGRIGAGDIVISTAMPGAGFIIGGAGALVLWATGDSWGQSRVFLRHCTLAGCYLGILRLGAEALAIRAGASYFLDWLHDVIVNAATALRGRIESDDSEPESTREVPVFNRGKPIGFVSLPEPTEFRVKTKKIPSVNLTDGIREISVDKLCLFLKSAVATGQWARDRQDILSQKEHPDVKAYLQGKGWWKISAPPALRLACAQLRGGVTNGTARTGTNEGAEQ